MRALLAVILALAAGVCIPVQTGINTVLAGYFGTGMEGSNPIASALVNFFVGTCVLAVAVAVLRLPLPLGQTFAAAPVWIWCAGALGAFLVAAATHAAPVLGAGTMLSVIVFSQMITALILDHFGLLGFPQTPVSWQRVVGVVMLVVGVVLIRKF